MTQYNGPWPPLVVAAHQPAWIRVRDVALTTGMWLLLVVMLNKEFGLFLGVYLDQLGFGTLLDLLGLADLDGKVDWDEFVGHLVPYLVVVVVLLAGLSIFATYTVLRRKRALGEATPRALSMARQARNAALTPVASRVGIDSTTQQANLGDMSVVDGRSLLAMLNDQAKDTLAEARTLRIAMVNVTAGGLYRINRVGEAVDRPP